MKLEFSRNIVNEANGIQENLNTLRKEIIQSELTVQIDKVDFYYFLYSIFTSGPNTNIILILGSYLIKQKNS